MCTIALLLLIDFCAWKERGMEKQSIGKYVLYKMEDTFPHPFFLKEFLSYTIVAFAECPFINFLKSYGGWCRSIRQVCHTEIKVDILLKKFQYLYTNLRGLNTQFTSCLMMWNNNNHLTVIWLSVRDTSLNQFDIQFDFFLQ